MSADRNNIEFIAAKVSAIERSMAAANDARLDAFSGLLSSIESSLADLVANLEAGGGEAAIKAMAEAIGKLKMPDVIYNPPAIAPVFNVPPAEVPKLPPILLAPESVAALASALRGVAVNIEAVMPALPAPVNHYTPPDQKGAKWKVTIPQPYGADKTMTIERL